MTNDRQWTQFVEKLTEDTNAGRITWIDQRAQPVREIFRENELGGLYTTSVLDKELLVYPYQYRVWQDDVRFEWRDDVAIEVIGRDGTRLFRIPEVGPRFALLSAIESQASGADDLLRRYLAT